MAAVERNAGTGSSAPVYVPLDSWVYPALRRLAALGYAPDLEGLSAPWSRSQCALLVKEAADLASRHAMKEESRAANDQAKGLLAALEQEFLHGHQATDEAYVESVYTRLQQIHGSPLRDSYHFGQSVINDFGRPYGEGTNTIDGFSAVGTLGRFSAYLRGEYQVGAGNAPYSPGVEDLSAALDGVPFASFPSRSSVKQFDPLEMYVGARLGGFNLTFGKQSSWWGPGEGSAFAFSNNAESLYSVKVVQETPVVLPGPLRFLGHIRTEFLLGRLAGNMSPPKPLLNAQKITFQLTPNFELGFTRSTIFGGVGHPLTTASVFRSFFSVTSTGSTAFGSQNDPGDRRSGFDFLWRLPGLGHLVTIYSDSLADDEPNPLASPRRSAWAPGIYFPRFLKQGLDLRFETYSTWLYRQDEGGRFLYWNTQYRDAYTNDNNLIGSWVGRDARAYTASSSYWWSAQNKLTAAFRQIKTGSNFLPGGGTQTDFSLTGQWALRSDLIGTAFTQFERYDVPVLGRPQHVVAAGFGLTFYPEKWQLRR